MNRTYWLLLNWGVAVAALSVACSSEFDSCEERRSCAPGGSAGVGEAGAAGEGPEQAGGKQGGSAGAGEGGSPEEGGSAGEGGASDAAPVLFGACSGKGAFACVDHAGAQRLACDGKLWQAGTTCAAGELCNSPDGMCAPVVVECASAKSGAVVCRKDTVLTCGPDLVTASEGKTCDGLCKLGVCQVPTCGDQKTEKGEDCDDPATTASGACVQCKYATCGDKQVYLPKNEQCDDGNKMSGDGCSATCQVEAVELALGGRTTCARSSTGLVKCWGNNRSGQLGLDNTTNQGNLPSNVPSALTPINLGTGRTARAISAGNSSVCALLDNGDAKCWGNNYSGQLGTGDNRNRGDSLEKMSTLNPIRLGTGRKAVGISAADTHVCAVLDDGTVKCWGSAEVGQLAQESKTDVPSPEFLPAIDLKSKAIAVSASMFYNYGKGGSEGGATCALLDNGTAKCWGNANVVSHDSSQNTSGDIGDSVGEISGLPALTFGGTLRATSIVAGGVSAAILDDGSLRLWGTGPHLAQPELSDTQVGYTPAALASLPAMKMGEKVKSVAVGKRHACAILESGVLKCWGEGSSGKLGLGSTDSTAAAPKDLPSVDLGGLAAQQVAVGEDHTCAILSNGTVKCWGANLDGQLGLGHQDARGGTGGKLSGDTTVGLTF